MRQVSLSLAGEKECLHCKIYKHFSEFNRENRSKSGYQTLCKVCQDLYRKANPYTKEQRRNVDLWSRYRIRSIDFDNLIENQDNKCGICKKELSSEYKKTHVDHCHTTGKVRGILCAGCNTALGQFNDSEEILNSAIKYLKSAKMK